MAVNIGIIGNIGAGKSSVMSEMKQLNPSYLYIDEPLSMFNTFETVDNITLHPLEMYYSSPNTLAAQFQLHAVDCFHEMVYSHQYQDTEHMVHIYDRIPHEVDIFTKSLYKLGQMHYFSYEYCRKKLSELLSKSKFKIDHIYYVNTPPDVCYDRIQSRKRLMETEYSNLRSQLLSLNTEYNEAIAQSHKHFQCYVTKSVATDVYGRAIECLQLIDNIIKSKQLWLHN